MRIWLSRINRHHSDRLAGPLTPFRRRDKPGSRRPVIWFSLLYYAMHNISTGKNIGCSVRFYGFGTATSAVGVTAGASITRITVFVCSGGQGATMRVQSITALKESHVRDSGAKSPRELELYPAQVNLFTRNLQKPVEKLIKIWHTGIIYLWGKVFCTLYATKKHREEDLTMTTGKRIFL